MEGGKGERSENFVVRRAFGAQRDVRIRDTPTRQIRGRQREPKNLDLLTS